MHVMNKESRILTIIGLVIEGFINVLSIIMAIVINTLPKDRLIEFFGDNVDYSIGNSVLFSFSLEQIFGVFSTYVIIITLLFLIIFMINIFFFTKLLTQQASDEVANKIYIYQLVIGIIHALSNLFLGIIYIVSGILGKKGLTDASK